MLCNANLKMLLDFILLSIFSFPPTIPSTSLTNQCSVDNYSISNSSSDFFQHVHQLVLEDCGLETIPEVLSTLSKLRVLSLESNKLVRIPSRVFRSNKRLRRLNLARNIISFVTRQSFVGRRLRKEPLILNTYSFLCFRSA